MSVKSVVSQTALNSSTAVLVKAANTNRKALYLSNDSAIDMLWGHTAATAFERLLPGATSDPITAFSAVYAKSASATPSITVREEAEI